MYILDQKIQSNSDEAPTVANELPTSSKSYTLLLPYTEQKVEHLIRPLKRTCIAPYMKTFKPEFVILVLNLVTNLITSKIQLRNPTNTRFSVMVHVLNKDVYKIALAKQIEN